MKKASILFSLLALVLVLSGCGDQNQLQEKGQSASQSQGGGMIASIKDAMGLGKAMKCTYEIGEGDQAMEMVTYVKGEQYRSESMFQGMKTMGVYDGDMMYNWTVGEKKGFKMSKKCTDELAQMNQNQNTNQEREMNQGEDVQNMEENFDNALNVKCEEVSNIDLSLPSDVEFVDQCEMLKNSMNQMQDMMNKYQGEMQGMPGMNQ